MDTKTYARRSHNPDIDPNLASQAGEKKNTTRLGGVSFSGKSHRFRYRAKHFKSELTYLFSAIHFFDQANNVSDIKLKSTIPPFFKFKKVSTIARSSEAATWSNSF